MTYRTKINLTDGVSLFKIIWITEENNSRHPGISNGFFGLLGNTHYTYHDNGLTHTVLGLPDSRKMNINEVLKIPIDDIEQYLQIHFQAIPIHTSNLALISAADTSTRAYDKILTLNADDFSGGLNIDTTIIRKGSEATFLDVIKGAFLSTFTLVGIEFIDLAYHANHRLAVTILASQSD